MYIEFVPSEAMGKDATFSGSVSIKEYTVCDSWALTTEVGMKYTQGRPDVTSMDGVMLGKVSGLCEKYTKAISLKHLKSGTEYKKFSDLNKDSRCKNMLIEIGNYLLHGDQSEKN